jgi:hypothetical protein
MIFILLILELGTEIVYHQVIMFANFKLVLFFVIFCIGLGIVCNTSIVKIQTSVLRDCVCVMCWMRVCVCYVIM